MNKEFPNRTRLGSELRSRKNIPAEFAEHLITCNGNPRFTQLRKALTERPEQTLNSIDRCFERVCSVTRMTGPELLASMDFEGRDIDPDRLDATFGVLRAIVFLDERGFVKIVPLRATRTRQADLRASFNGQKFAIEVMTSSRSSYRYAGHVNRSSDLECYIVDKYQERKQAQLESTAKEINADCRLFVLVLNSNPARLLMQRDEYLEVLQNAYQDLSGPKQVFLGIVTGLSSDGLLDDIIYPDLPTLAG